MSKKILHEITDEDLETGLRGIPVGYCVTSRVDAQQGLFYHDKAIRDLVNYSPEAILHFLIQGELDTGPALESFVHDINKRSVLTRESRDAILALSRKVPPMNLFSAAMLLVGGLEGKNNYRDDCIDMIAKLPEIVAVLINHHAGWGTTSESKPQSGYIENFVSMLNVPGDVDKVKLCEVFRLFYILHLDHGGGNLSAFTGKTVASGLADMWKSIAGAVNALAGPRHGMANQEGLEFVKDVHSVVGDDPSISDVEQVIRDKLKKKELIYGFGHAVLRVEDPRATIFYEFAKMNFPKDPLVKTALALREAGPRVLKENPKVANPYPNVDAMSGTLMTAAGFPYPEYYTVLFGLARMAGIAVQIVYERMLARGGKGVPITRPKYIYKPKGSC